MSNQEFVRTILPSTEPVAKSSMRGELSSSRTVWVTSGSIFFSATQFVGKNVRGQDAV
jgi:hypothetical protein